MSEPSLLDRMMDKLMFNTGSTTSTSPIAAPTTPATGSNSWLTLTPTSNVTGTEDRGPTEEPSQMASKEVRKSGCGCKSHASHNPHTGNYGIATVPVFSRSPSMAAVSRNYTPSYSPEQGRTTTSPSTTSGSPVGLLMPPSSTGTTVISSPSRSISLSKATPTTSGRQSSASPYSRSPRPDSPRSSPYGSPSPYTTYIGKGNVVSWSAPPMSIPIETYVGTGSLP